MADQHIPIDDNTGHVTPPHDNQHLSKLNDDEAVWDDANNTGPFSVEFNPKHHPFTQWKFMVQKGGSTASGPVVTGDPGDTFDYKINGTKTTNDPRIIIDG